jgi:hypothetical protein
MIQVQTLERGGFHGQERYNTQDFWCAECNCWITLEDINDSGHKHFTKDTRYFGETRLAYKPYGNKDREARAKIPYNSVSNPHHYTKFKITPLDAIDEWGLGFCLGNAVKYIGRAGHKGDTLEDLKKAAWYLNHEIEQREKQEKKA